MNSFKVNKYIYNYTYGGIFLEKIAVAQLVSNNLLFKESEILSPWTQTSANFQYQKPDESSPSAPTRFLQGGAHYLYVKQPDMQLRTATTQVILRQQL
jgi:hypothetical protein